jgi:glycine/D-amino acid oxidase-like deaminating enzyme
VRVSRLPHDPGPAAWNALLPPAVQRSALSDNTWADWLVIGAGFAGLAAAYRLAELHPTDRIVVLEASCVAEGPAGRNTGFMIDLPHDLTSDDYGGGDTSKDKRAIRLNRAGIAYALNAKSALKMSDESIVASGKFNGAISDRGVSHNKAYAQYLDRLGEPYQRLDAHAMQLLTGTSCYIDGLYSPGSVMIQPAMYIRSLATGAESSLLTIYERSPVLKLERVESHWRAHTSQGTIKTPKVILTVNGHLESFGFSKRRLMHVFTYGSMTRSLTQQEVRRLGGEAVWGITPADPLGTTVRRISGTGGDRIIIRNRATFDPSLTVPTSRLTRVARTHDRSFKDRFPMLADVSMEYRWGGRLCLSRNNVSAFGEIDTNLYSACCQNGLGTAKGTISGKLAAELASNQTSALLDDQLSDEELIALPPGPVAALGAKARLRWGEFRAGREL